MFGCLILFLCGTIKYLEVKDLTLTMIVILGFKFLWWDSPFIGGIDIGGGVN